MDSKKSYADTSALFAQYSSPEEVDVFNKYLTSRKLSKALFALRCKAGLTQLQVAEKSGFTQSKVSKIEHSKDVDLSVGDILSYCKAIDIELNVALIPDGTGLVNKVKFHWFEIQMALNEIQKISKGDEDMEKAAKDFTVEAAYNISNGMIECLGKVVRIPSAKNFFTVSTPTDSMTSATKEGEIQQTVHCCD